VPVPCQTAAAMHRFSWRRWHWAVSCALLAVGCAAPSGPAQPHAYARSPLFPFEDAPHPSSREQLVKALHDRGLLPPDAQPDAGLDRPIRTFQRSQGLLETGWPDDETLRRLGIDPRTRDSSLSPSTEYPPGATEAGVGH
jgi:hypothetical protein